MPHRTRSPKFCDPMAFPLPPGWTLVRNDAMDRIMRMIPPERLPGAERLVARSKKATRGLECKRVIQDIKALRALLMRRRPNLTTFESLRGEFPAYGVLEILSRAPFDDEDRELVCRPHRQSRAETYAYGILKKYFGVNSNATIRDYIKEANRELRQVNASL